jgi:16S rRNA (adenine1518-N6/adenine1519-N6)-dimethyltransferase
MRRFEIRPDRELGQNFLVDSNILGVIERAAEVGPNDVVFEVGGGLGVLSEHLAARARHVHVVEIDERLREALLDATDRHANVTVHWGDAMTMDLAGLRPTPTKVVANLPYGVAAGALLRTIELLGEVELWVAMAQKEVGERLAAAPGSDAYGVPSAIAQLACEVRVIRAIPRGVFYPVPNVDSALVGMRRTGPAASAGVRALVNAAFAHRRKTLAGSLEVVGRVGESSKRGPPRARGGSLGEEGLSNGGVPRARTRAALAQLGLPEDVRAERCSPADFQALAAKLGIA